MRRRHGLGLALSVLASAPRTVWTQPAQRVARVGVLRPSGPARTADDLQFTGLPRALAELGYVEGRNLVIEQRFASGDLLKLPTLALELQQARVELVIAVGVPAILAVKQAAPSLPIVMFGNFDPVALGLIPSLARPGGNITGVLIAPDGTLAGKRLELLKAAVPQATRMAYLAPPADPATRLQLQETRRAASMLGVELVDVEVRDGDYERAFAAIAVLRPSALVVAANNFFVRDRLPIIALAAKHKLPAIYEWREQVLDGGLMAYSTSLYGMYQRLAWYVDRILRGAKPGELAVERPSKFELIINLRTAKTLGLGIPPALLLRADEVIE